MRYAVRERERKKGKESLMYSGVRWVKPRGKCPYCSGRLMRARLVVYCKGEVEGASEIYFVSVVFGRHG